MDISRWLFFPFLLVVAISQMVVVISYSSVIAILVDATYIPVLVAYLILDAITRVVGSFFSDLSLVT